jgi:hypothetical protein
MTEEQQKTYANFVKMRDDYGSGVFGWQLLDGVTSVGALVASLSAGVIIKFTDFSHSSDAAAALALGAAICAGIQKKYQPTDRLRKDWKARGALHELLGELDANSKFDPQDAVKRMNKVIREHDEKFVW